jgi:outer membrane protein assembly factor BamB
VRNSYASPTPSSKRAVYVHFGAAGTACLDTKTGKPLWTVKDRELDCNHFRGAASSPIIVGDKLILTFDGFDYQYLTALNTETGETVWRTDRKFDYGTDHGDAMKAYSTRKSSIQANSWSDQPQQPVRLTPATPAPARNSGG